MRAKSLLSRLARVAVSTLFIVWVIRHSGMENILDAFSKVRVSFFIAAIASFAASGVLGSFQWYLLLRHHKLDISYGRAVAYYFTGLFFNNFLPSNLGGDVVRILQVEKKTRRGTTAFSSTLADRAFGFSILLSIAMITTLASSGGNQSNILPVLTGILGLFLAFFFIIVFRGPGLVLRGILKRAFPQRIFDILQQIYRELRSFRSEPYKILMFLFISTGVQFLRILVHFLCARSIGITESFHHFLIIIPIVAIAASLPISVGGLGVREKSATVLFQELGVEPALVVTMELLAFLAGIIAAIPGGIYFILVREKRE